MTQSEKEPGVEWVVKPEGAWVLAEPGHQFRNFSSRGRRILEVLIDAVIPHATRFDFDHRYEIAVFVDTFMDYLPRLTALALPIGLHVINWSAVLYSGRTMTARSALQNEAHLRRLLHSPVYLIREGVKALRGVAMMGFYSHPLVRARLGYAPGPWIDRLVAERITRFGLRVPELLEIAHCPGGPSGVKIAGHFVDSRRTSGSALESSSSFSKASVEEIQAAERALEMAIRESQKLQSIIDQMAAQSTPFGV